MRNVPPHQRRWTIHRHRSQRDWPDAQAGVIGAGTARSSRIEHPGEPIGSRGDSRWPNDSWPETQRGLLHHSTHRRAVATRVARQGGSAFVRSHPDLLDAVVRNHADGRRASRSHWLPVVTERALAVKKLTKLLVGLLLVVASYRLDAQVTSDRILRAADEPQNWLTYSGGYASQRYSLLKQIDTSNVKNL